MTPPTLMTTPELPKSYTPAVAEGEVRARWDAVSPFHADANAPGERFCILIPPPNVTAALHLGHAFNNTLQDVLIRFHRMRGDNTLWMPGTDHAGIATQTVVERRLLLQGKRRTDFSRDEFIAKVQDWKDEYEATIIEQLKAMGCSCDWDRTRFTMDEVCAKAVREAFFRLFKDGLIYRGKRLVNWDPVTQTALADDEVEMEEVQGHMWYLRYPIENAETQKQQNAKTNQAGAERSAAPGSSQRYVTVATTRPETMLGDTAIAINPKDPRAAQYVGKHVRLPIVNRVVPIIADDYVVRPVQYGGDANDPKAQIATGFLKVTPAHDPNDYEIGLRHNLPLVNVLAPDATISDKHGWLPEDVSDEAKQFIGLSREEARKRIVQWFKDHDLLEDVKPYTHSVGHSYRSHVPIEPYLSDQWYVRVMDDRLRGEALRAMAAEQREATENGGTGVPPVRITKFKGAPDHLTIHRRNLPHWQIGGSTYFVTFRLLQSRLSEEERQVVAESCMHWHGTRMHLHLATVMPDHVHLILTPLKKNETTWHSLPELMHSVKSHTAHEIQRRRGAAGPLWQDEYFDRIIRDDEEFYEKWEYILNNPVKAGLAAAPPNYPFTVQPGEDSHGRNARATRSGDGELQFFPARYAKTFQAWHENLRDWCISRQLWWGHRIPVWSILSKDLVEPGYQDLLEMNHKGKWTMRVGEGDWDEAIAHVAVAPDAPEVEALLNEAGAAQDPDVLDTWFSSALWPISTMGWPDPEAFPDQFPEGGALLDTFNPSTVLVTGRDIITLWVSRMVMFNRYLRDGTLPFRHVYINPMIQDGHGQRMSKSLGNGVDPRDIIHSHGADALRFLLVKIATSTQDVRLPVDMICPHCEFTFHPKEITSPAGYRVAAAEQACPHCKKMMISGYGAASGLASPTAEIPLARNSSAQFDLGRNFANKIWNATRFALSKLTAADAHGLQSVGVPELKQMSLVDRWIISRLHRTLHAVEDALKEYQFNTYADAMYDLVWRDFCDWYVEAIKPTVNASPAQQQVLRTMLNAIMRLLHPIMPFVTESLWPHVNACAGGLAGLEGIKLPPSELLANAAWPDIKCSVDDEQAVATFQRVQSLVETIRSLKTERQVQKKPVRLWAPPEMIALINSAGGVVEALAGIESIQRIADHRPDPGAIPLAFEGRELMLGGLVEAVDVASEKARLTKVIVEKERAVAGFTGRLNNAGYVSKAPPEKVEETRTLLAQAQADLAAARKALESLG